MAAFVFGILLIPVGIFLIGVGMFRWAFVWEVGLARSIVKVLGDEMAGILIIIIGLVLGGAGIYLLAF